MAVAGARSRDSVSAKAGIRRNWWAGALALFLAGLAWRAVKARPRGEDQRHHGHALPGTRAYDRGSGLLLGRFFARVAAREAGLAGGGELLEVGSGPGRLAVALAEAAPDLHVTALDLDPAMVERARARVREAGLDGRVTVTVGDAASLPLGDNSVDRAVSTFSAHHWDDLPGALAELHRVLRPGAQARIYDMAPWILRRRHPDAPGLEAAALASQFGAAGRTRCDVVGRLGPVPLVVVLTLERSRFAE